MQKFARFFLGIVITSLVGAWLYTHDSTAMSSDSPEYKNALRQLSPLNLKQFDAAIKGSEKPTLLFFYASWCPHCRAQMPHILAMEKRRADDVQVLYVSIDEDPTKLSAFLSNTHTNDTFKPYILAAGEGRKFSHYLKSRNSSFRGGVPYSAVFQPNGQLTHEFLGRAPIAKIEAALD